MGPGLRRGAAKNPGDARWRVTPILPFRLGCFHSSRGGPSMAHTLEQFAAECHHLLKADPGPEGRKKVCGLVQEVLKDEAFVAAHLGDDVPERKILYEDPELGFCILGH